MKILATIAARGGSKGVPGKNIRNLAGRPLIVYTIEQILRWGKFEKFIISTDSKEIADIASEYGAEVPFMRPTALAGDTVGKLDALRHALMESEKHYGAKFDALLDLDATAPIRTVNDIDNIVKLFQEKDAECVFSVVKSHKNPYFNMIEKRTDGTAELCKQPSVNILSRQASPAVYDLNASIYVYDRKFLLDANNKTPISKRSFFYEMDQISGVDIDTEVDFKFVEFLIKEGIVKL